MGKSVKKNKSQNKRKSKEELYLESLVLGDSGDVIQKLEYNGNLVKKKRKTGKKKNKNKIEKRKPAWVDHDDDAIRTSTGSTVVLHEEIHKQQKSLRYSVEVRSRFNKIAGNPSWASLEKKKERKHESDEEDEILKRVGNYIIKSTSLPHDTIKIKKCSDIPASDLVGSISSVEFHPSAQVALVAGLRNTTSLFQIDGSKNPEIQSIFFEDFPISCAHFSTDGQQFVVSSRSHKYYYVYDMMAGKTIKVPWTPGLGEVKRECFYTSPDGKLIVFPGTSGAMHFSSTRTNEWLFSLKMNANVQGITFNNDGTRMYSTSKEGEVYIWDMNARECLHKFYDDGCIEGSSISLSPNQQYLACGQNTGVVNLYDASSVLFSETPKPLKAIMNLTTEVDSLKFNSSSEILVLNSSEKKNAIKLLHCQSMKVFLNFPLNDNYFGRITSFDMSLNSGFLATGTKKGICHLFRLNHYENF